MAWLLGVPSSASAEHDYVGVAKCRTCHKKDLIGNQYSVWQQGPHARAFETLASEASQAIAVQRGIEGPAQEAAECLECHSTAHGVPAERQAYPLDAALGVQCESCHGPGRDYRKKTVMSDRDEAVAKGLWDADASLCVTCHNERSPTFDPERYVVHGGTSGFDFDQAVARIRHAIPEDVKGNYIALEKKAKEEARARR